MTGKTCKQCNQSLPISNFYRQPESRDKLTHICKGCYKANRQNPADKTLIGTPQSCRVCNKVKPIGLDTFYRNPAYSTGWDTECIECHKARQKRYDQKKKLARFQSKGIA